MIAGKLKGMGIVLLGCWCMLANVSGAAEGPEKFDVVVVSGTPGGIMAAVAAARNGHSAIILERTEHIGGLPANGLGASDIATRGATAGLFREFIQRVKKYYVATYGEKSEEVKDCSDGYHFEPKIAEKVFEDLLAEHADKITVRKGRQFDAEPENVTLKDGRLVEISVLVRATKSKERYAGKVFIDASYEGDLAAAAGAPFRVGREGFDEFREPMAGRIYKKWGGDLGLGSSGEGDNAIQAYNYRLCLTNKPENRVPIAKPKRYNREEFASFVDDMRGNIATGKADKGWVGIVKVLNPVGLPRGKVDANNQHLAFISSDLPEENWPWPTSGWDWRDRYAERLREYTLGLIWFAQNDPEVPAEVREKALEWGLAKDEYTDNENFPRQVYVREGRRIIGEYLFTAHDAIPVKAGERPPVHSDSITASHYPLDSHAVRKREPGRVHLDGFFSMGNRPYTVPYGVIVPKRVEGLLTPVPVSGTHVGFSTLRMEPCWMAMGQAAGEAASLAIEKDLLLRKVPVAELQQRLLKQQGVLIYFEDARAGDKHFEALQFFAVRKFLPATEWKAKLSDVVTEETAQKWMRWASVEKLEGFSAGKTTRGELLEMLYEKVRGYSEEKMAAVKGEG
ncbi:MAG: FAD-dependent oxidoreductase [Planctomycetaceae bacterium]